MPATATDRLNGLTTSVAVKPPCIAVTSANITLAGLQTIGGVVLTEGDRVLVRAQTSSVDNGIYNASTSDWTRAKDFDGNRDVVQGTLVLVFTAVIDGAFYSVTTPNPVVIGTSEIEFELRDDPAVVYLQSQEEIDAGVSVVNDRYLYGHVDRYKLNAVPGTTDMAAAFTAAVKVAARGGCHVTWGATRTYRLNSPIDCTQVRGIVFSDQSSANVSSSAYGPPSVVIAHTGHGFDCSASTELVFDMSATNLAGTVPKNVIFLARNAAGSGCGQHKIRLRTPNTCTFTDLVYSYGSEENEYEGYWQNSQPGSSLLNINATNPRAHTSTFITIATGNQSNASHSLGFLNLFNYGNSGSSNEVCIALERANNFTWDKGLAYCPHGLAYISVGGTVGSISLTLRSIRGETDGAATTLFGIAVRTTAATGVDAHTHWTLDAVEFQSTGSGAMIDCNSTSDIVNLKTSCCKPSTGRLLNVHSLSSSVIEHQTSLIDCQSGGTVASCSFTGSKSAITFSGTNTNNTGFDQATGRTWETGDSLNGASAACTGALTAASGWSITRKSGVATLILPGITGTASAAASFAFGTVIPVGYRPANDVEIQVAILNNSVRTITPGYIKVAAATGVITVFKDNAGGNWTAAAGAGLTAQVSMTWPV